MNGGILIMFSFACFMQRTFSKPVKSIEDAKLYGFDCRLRGGREMLLKVSKEKGSYLQSVEQGTGKTVDHKDCLTLGDDIYCETWHIRDSKTKNTYKFKGVDQNGNTLWEGKQYIVPHHALFYCYQNHHIKNVKVANAEGGIGVRWDINYWDNLFSPRHIVTVNGVRNGQELHQSDCHRSSCQIIVPKGSKDCNIKNICIKTKFDLKDGVSLYKRRHMTRTCTTFKPTCAGVP